MEQSVSRYNQRLTIDFLLAPKIEDQTFDRKSMRINPVNLASALVGMANADGGTIAIGIRDRQFENIDEIGSDRQNEIVQASINFCQPMVRLLPEYVTISLPTGKQGRLLLLHVEQGLSD